MPRGHRERVALPDAFIELSEEMTSIKDEYDEMRYNYLNQVAHMIEAGHSLAQIAEISPYPYANMRVWLKKTAD